MRPDVLADRRGAVALLFGLLAPLLVLAVAFGVDVPGWYRDALYLQGLADRAALSAGPMWAEGDAKGAIAVATALVALDGAALDYAGANRGTAEGFEIIVSSHKAHLLSAMPLGSERLQARAVALGARLAE